MKYTAERLVEIALGEVGYHEKNSNQNLDQKTAPNDGSGNYTKYARDLYAAGYYNGNKNGYAWCDISVDWDFFILCERNAARAQAMQCQTGPLGAACRYSAQYYRKAGRYDKTPSLGAQAFFGPSGAETHTGIVVAYSGTTVTLVEGNSSDRVEKRTYKRSDPKITGYGHPLFDGAAPTDAAPDSPEEIVYTVVRGDTLGRIAKSCNMTYQELAAYNGIPDPNRIYPGQKIRIPV